MRKLICVLLVLGCGSVQAENFVLAHTFENPSPNTDDLFGRSVSVSGDRVLVGARGDDTTGDRSGRAYLFDAVSGNLVHTFENPSPEGAFDFFGISVSVSGDRVLVGARGDDTTGANSGRAYLFDAVSGNLVHTFENPSPDDGDEFGNSVSVSGDRVLVGADHDDTTGNNSGRAYLFDAVSGNLVHTFENPSPDDFDGFGTSVSASGDRVLVGARFDDTTGDRSWRAYLFDAVSGNLVHTFENPSPDDDDFDTFGIRVSVSGDRLLVGVSDDNTTGFDSGRAYLFDAVSGNLVHTFENPSPNNDDSFGRSVSVSGDRVLVGTDRDDTTGNNSGRAYLFDAVSGNLVHTFENPSPDDGDGFGFSVSVSGDRVLVGAYNDSTAGKESGSAYLFYDSNQAPVTAMIDIRPGSDRNAINPRSKGVIPVAILSTNTADGDSTDFDATQVDTATVVFGPGEALTSHPGTTHVRDVDADRDADLVLHFGTEQTGIVCGATGASLQGETFAGETFSGTDTIETVGCPAQYQR